MSPSDNAEAVDAEQRHESAAALTFRISSSATSQLVSSEALTSLPSAAAVPPGRPRGAIGPVKSSMLSARLHRGHHMRDTAA